MSGGRYWFFRLTGRDEIGAGCAGDGLGGYPVSSTEDGDCGEYSDRFDSALVLRPCATLVVMAVYREKHPFQKVLFRAVLPRLEPW